MQAGSIDGKLCSLFSVTTFNLIVSASTIVCNSYSRKI
jgi:hypothetical protein